jgi:hypothetical protein
MDAITVTIGSIVILVTATDVFFTVLFPASGHGPVRKPLSWVIWKGFATAACLTAGQRRRNLLSYSGPTLIAATLIAWFMLLAAGWAMIYEPAMGGAIRSASGAPDTGWSAALYFSGFNLTTLGVGDITAETPGYRILSIVEAGLGFAWFSMAITYFLSVYSSLTARNAFAHELHELTRGSDDPLDLIGNLLALPDTWAARAHLASKADALRAIHQTHRFYPVLRFFHYREPFYELPRILMTVLDASSLLEAVAARDPERQGRRFGLQELGTAGLALLRDLTPSRSPSSPDEAQRSLWTERLTMAREALAKAGLDLSASSDVAARLYITHRTTWQAMLSQLGASMLYDPSPQRDWAADGDQSNSRTLSSPASAGR